jgi:hypothetical protein
MLMFIRKLTISFLVIGCTGLLIHSPLSLEIDEKLTTRFLKVSRTKKTVLLNRGLEDGLVVGDHAKFFLTTGVIARGTVVKASPTRTIWSVYRLVDADKVFPDKVVNIKMTKPITMTEDPTKSLYDTSNFSAGTEVMSIRGDDSNVPARVRGINLNKDEQNDLESLGDLDYRGMNGGSTPGVALDKTLEAFGLVHFSSLSSSVDEGEGNTFIGKESKINFSLGIEKYFNNTTGFLNKLSFLVMLHSGSNQTASVQGQQVTTAVTEYGVGVNFHYIAPALSYNRLIGFSGLSLGVGSVKDTVEVLNVNSTNASNEFDGSSSFIALATGIKYYTRSGFGMRAVLDYYRRSESYSFENQSSGEIEEVTKVASGPRLMVGLSYRW